MTDDHIDAWILVTQDIRVLEPLRPDFASRATMFLDPNGMWALELLPAVDPFSSPPEQTQKRHRPSAAAGGESRMESPGMGGH